MIIHTNFISKLFFIFILIIIFIITIIIIITISITITTLIIFTIIVVRHDLWENQFLHYLSGIIYPYLIDVI